MTRGALIPDAPQISASFFLDQFPPAEALALISAEVERAGATATGVLEGVRAPSFPAFAMISDLAPRLEVVLLDPRTRTVPESSDPTFHVVRTGFAEPDIGPVVVGFDPVPGGIQRDVVHPISITIGGWLLSRPPQPPLASDQQEQALAASTFLLSVFRSVCEDLDPLYAAIAVESALPPPMALMTGAARLGTELFVSDRHIAPHPELDEQLSATFGEGFSERWSTGKYWSGWAPFNRAARTVSAPLNVGMQAAGHLGRTLSTDKEAIDQGRMD
jgi:hypothetical protein